MHNELSLVIYQNPFNVRSIQDVFNLLKYKLNDVFLKLNYEM